MNYIWLFLMISSVILGCFNGHLGDVVQSVIQSAQQAFQLVLGLGGIMCFWLGIMHIAEESGLIRLLGRLMRPAMTWLFPEVPADHPAMGAMVMNITANMMGLNNAATPLGLRAMKELQNLNPQPQTASNAMCMFLAINTSSVQLIPTTAIAYLAAAGSKNPTQMIAPALLATMCSTLVAIITARILQSLKWFQPSSIPNKLL